MVERLVLKKFDKREGTSALSFCHNPPQQKGWSAWESKAFLLQKE